MSTHQVDKHISPSKQQLVAAQSSPAQQLASTSKDTYEINDILTELTNNLGVNCEEFQNEEFDCKKYTNAIIKTRILSDHLTKLTQCICLLDEQIREQVSLHHENLLQQAINIESLEEMLDMVHSRIISLKSTSERLRIKITSPFNELNLRIIQLSRLQGACDMLRRIKGIIHHTAKLKVQMQSGSKDLIKSAQSLNELEFLLKNFDTNGIDIIEKDIHYIHKARHECEEQGNSLLEIGLTHQNQTQISTAIQVFLNLGCLMNKINDSFKNYERKFNKQTLDLLNPVTISLQSTTSTAQLHGSASTSSLAALTGGAQGGPGRSTMPGIGSMSQFRASLWSNVEKLIDQFYDTCAQIVHLQKILIKKRDLLLTTYSMQQTDSSENIALSKLLKQKIILSSSYDDDTDNSSRSPGDSTVKYDEYEQTLNKDDDMSQSQSSSSCHKTQQSIEFLYEYWRLLVSILNTNLNQVCIQSNYIKQTFQNEYPKLLKLYNDLWLRVLQLNPLIERYIYLNAPTTTKGSNTVQQPVTAYELLRKCFVDLENSYLTRSLTNLFDPINLIFCQNTTQMHGSGSGMGGAVSSSSSSTIQNDLAKKFNPNDIEQFMKQIQVQIQTIQYDITISVQFMSKHHELDEKFMKEKFSYKVINTLCKAIKMFSNKCEQYLTYNDSSAGVSKSASSGGLTQLTTTNTLPTQEQLNNLDCINVAFDLYEQLQKLFDDTKQLYSFDLLNYYREQLDDSLNKYLLELITNSIQPSVQCTCDYIEAVLLTVHSEDLSGTQATSAYIRELQQLLQRLCKDYFNLFNCRGIINTYLKQISARCLELFMRHACMVRPLNEQTRKRILNDSVQIEQICTNLCSKLSDLGSTYKQFKSFKQLLQLNDYLDVEQVQQLGDHLPISLILHFLISAQAPSDLKLPHVCVDWSIVRYSQWLDNHSSEKERLIMVKNCLEMYVNLIKQKNEKQFANIYPVLVQLLEKGLQQQQPPQQQQQA